MNSPATNAPRTRRSLAAGAALALLSIGVAGCVGSGGGDQTSGAAAEQNRSHSVAPAADAPAGAAQVERSLPTTADSLATEGNLDPVTAETDRALIRTGAVALRSGDVAKARFNVKTIVATYAGEVSQDNTEADKDGDAERAMMVLRIPVTDFDAAMEDLKGVGDLIDTSTSTDDVTTQVIDTDVRVRLQRRSIDRISLLLDRAQSIRDIVNIERELSRREADLGSLEKQQTYLADQSAMSTITVSLERPPEKAVEKKKDDAAGFFSGLKGGWHALTSVTVGLLTVAGAVLPFAVIALLVGVPLWVTRRRPGRRGQTA